jgi:hypothetical protein
MLYGSITHRFFTKPYESCSTSFLVLNGYKLKYNFIFDKKQNSDGWSDRIDVAKDYYEEAVGSFSIKAYSPKVTEFDKHFANLNPSNNLRNEWFNEYWEEMFKCHIEEATRLKHPTPCKSKTNKKLSVHLFKLHMNFMKN